MAKSIIKTLFILLINIILYIYFGGLSILILSSTSLLLYLLGKIILKKHSKFFLILGIIITLIPLVYFRLDITTVSGFIAPLGISYYSLELIAFLVDIYRGEIKELSFSNYLLYVFFVPCVFIGPINKYNDLVLQFKDIKVNEKNIGAGIVRVAVGLFKKFIIANSIALIVGTISKDINTYYGLYIVLCLLLYSLELYADFSGGSDMVIGISKIFNINLVENFDSPFFSENIKEFWRRWHISLGTWLKNYIYIPLGGNRVSNFRTKLNSIITFLVSGIWHGFNYLIWGLIHGILAAFDIKTKNKYINRVITYIIVSFTFVFFVYGNISNSFLALKNIFIDFNIADVFNNINNLGLDNFGLIVLLIGTIILILYDTFRLKIYDFYSKLSFNKKLIISLSIIVIVIVFGVYGIGFNGSDFIYSKF